MTPHGNLKGEWAEWIRQWLLVNGNPLGQCHKAATEMLAAYPEGALRIAKGHVFDAAWGMRQHWWLVDSEGDVVDPTVSQFPAPMEWIEYEDGQPIEMGTCWNCSEPIVVYSLEEADRRGHSDKLCNDECARAYAAYCTRGF